MNANPQTGEDVIVHEVETIIQGSDVERFVVVAGDLDFLARLPTNRLMTHTEVRVCAGIMRRLFVDGQLMAVWRLLTNHSRVQPTVISSDLDSALRNWPEDWLWYAWAGGAVTGVARHAGLIMSAVPPEVVAKYGSVEGFFEANPVPKIEPRARFNLDTWLKSSAAAIKGIDGAVRKVSRRTMLAYVANRKGGVHFDDRRSLDNSGRARSRNEELYKLLDHGLVRIGHLSGPEFEISSMAQAVSESDWSQRIIERIEERMPVDFDGDPRELKFWSGQAEQDGSGWATSRFESE